MGLRDRSDDRQPEAGAAAASRAVAAGEALERRRGRRGGPGRRRGRGGGPRRRATRPPARSDRPAVADARCRAGCPSACSSRSGSASTTSPSAATTVASGAWRSRTRSSSSPTRSSSRADRQLALVAAGDHQQVLGERDEPVGLLGGRPQRVGQLLVRAPARQRELELGLEDRQRRPELVAGVGDERPLARERRLDAVEHRVQGRRRAGRSRRPSSGTGSRAPRSVASISAARARMRSTGRSAKAVAP